MAACAINSVSSAWSMASLGSTLPRIDAPSASSIHFPARFSPYRLKLYRPNPQPRIPQSFMGCRVFAMRHGRRVPKLNRPPDQRRALLRGLTTQLLKHGRIMTTRARAKAMRKFVDHMITLAKEGTLHKRRQALGFIYEKQIVHALFAEVQERYGDRNGGYTRIIRTLPRRGDNAPMAYIELV